MLDQRYDFATRANELCSAIGNNSYVLHLYDNGRQPVPVRCGNGEMFFI
jgi:hypothetical protein